MREKIAEIVLEVTGNPLGCYDHQLDKIADEDLETLRQALDYGGNTDIPMTFDGVRGAVEIEYWDGEVDLNFMDLITYKELYNN